MGAIRLFLAIAVVQSHVRSHVLTPANLFIGNVIVLGMNGGYAVLFFFVVSGFLISFVLDEKYNRPGGTADFYRARMLRIYPLWWSLYIIVPFLTEGGLRAFVDSRHWYDLATGFFLYGSDWLLSFWTYPAPYTAPMPHGLELGWTLASEMMFYLLAPFVLRSRLLPWLVFGASAATRVVMVSLHPQGAVDGGWESYCYYFLPATIMFFMLGHLARRLSTHLKLRQRNAWLALGLAAFVCLAQNGRFGFDNIGLYLSILLFAISLPAIFAATKDNRICNFLGDLTYPLYLSHGVMMALIASPDSYLNRLLGQMVALTPALPLFGANGLRTKAALISVAVWLIALAIAAIVHFLIERPATSFMRSALAIRLRPRRQPSRDSAE